MWPSILNPAGERDGRALGQRGGVKIDLEVCQLPADARIEGTVVVGLREDKAWRGDRTSEQCRERAAIDDHDCSSLSKPVVGRQTLRSVIREPPPEQKPADAP